jgi:hypothetical protein
MPFDSTPRSLAFLIFSSVEKNRTDFRKRDFQASAHIRCATYNLQCFPAITDFADT